MTLTLLQMTLFPLQAGFGLRFFNELTNAAGIGVGITIGLFVGLYIRARRGNREGLVGNSVLLTAILAGIACMWIAALMKTLVG